MRWLVTIVATVCLLAATGHANSPGRDDPHAAHLKQTSALPKCAAARRHAPGHDLRLPAFVLAAPPIVDEPPRASCEGADKTPAAHPPTRAPNVCSRGPPAG